MAEKKHCYEIEVVWTGDLGKGTSDYRAYSRNHEFTGPGKQSRIHGSSDPVYRGDASCYSPEELLVASLSACHMLWVLHLCADSGIVVTGYSDHATAVMLEEADGSGRFVEVMLNPVVRITDSARIPEALSLHEKAHALCFIANSVRFPVLHNPRVVTADA
jgi:organic hydroperoxide reductase OsmC/OhrA